MTTTLASSEKALETINTLKHSLNAKGLKVSNKEIVEYLVTTINPDAVYTAIKANKITGTTPIA